MKLISSLLISFFLSHSATSDLESTIKAKIKEIGMSEKRISTKMKECSIDTSYKSNIFKKENSSLYQCAADTLKYATFYSYTNKRNAYLIKLWLPITMREEIKSALDKLCGRSGSMVWGYPQQKRHPGYEPYTISLEYYSRYCILSFSRSEIIT